MRALFTVASVRALVHPKVEPREEAEQNLLPLSVSEWHVEDASSGEEEIFNARRLLQPRSPWAVKGGLFSSRKGPRLSCGYLTAILSQTRAQLNAKYLGGHNTREICFRNYKRNNVKFTINREADG